MKTSESITKIAPALLAAQKSVDNATKNAKNPHFKNNYANLSAVIEAVKEAFNAAGITILQPLEESRDGQCYVTTRLVHESGEWIEATASAPMPKADPQGVGSATTYLRRYGLAAMACITQDDDDGEGARPPAPSSGLKTQGMAQEGATAEQVDKLKALEAEPKTNERVKTALGFYKAKSVADLTKDQAATVIAKISGA